MSPLSTNVERARAYTRTPEFSKVWRYASVSAISTVLSLGLLFIFYRVAKIEPFWSNVLATAIATVPSYYLNRMWAWGKTGKSHLWREVIPFWVIALVSLGVSSGAVDLAAKLAKHYTTDQNKISAAIELANFFTYGILWVGKFTIFNKILFKHDHSASALQDDEEYGVPVSGIDAASAIADEFAPLESH